jgi:hypothetical protein
MRTEFHGWRNPRKGFHWINIVDRFDRVWLWFCENAVRFLRRKDSLKIARLEIFERVHQSLPEQLRNSDEILRPIAEQINYATASAQFEGDDQEMRRKLKALSDELLRNGADEAANEIAKAVEYAPSLPCFGWEHHALKVSDNQAAAKVAQFARNMASGYAAHIALIRVAPRVSDKAAVQLIADYPTDSVQRKDGTKWSFDTQNALVSAVADEAIAKELPRVWLAGSLLAVSDELKRNEYFDHAPELELVRHLRNGIAHGNRFAIQKLTYPAHNRGCFKNTIFEITPKLNGQPVLFDFMDAGDVLDLLYSVADHVEGIGRGQS